MAYPFESFDVNPDQVKSPKRDPHRTGNRCGHEPSTPRFAIKEHPYQKTWSADDLDGFGHHRKSAWFYDVASRLQEVYCYPRLLPALSLIYRDLKSRLHRSEAREADCSLMMAITHHIELASVNWQEGFCRVGRPSKDGFVYYDSKYWMQKTGLTLSRLKRAFKRLEKAGFIRRERRWVERSGGKFKGLATMLLVTHAFYSALGLLDGLKDAAHFAYQRLKQEADKLQTQVGRMLTCAVTKAREYTAKRKQKTAARSDDYPPTSPQHWEAKLSEPQILEFRHRYLSLLLERGSGDPESIYRDAYKSLIMQA